MKLDTFLNYLITHNTTIIEVLIGLVLLAVLILSIRTFMYGKEESSEAGSPASIPELEASLKKILEKANQVPSVAAAAAGGAGADTTALLSEISKLKAELEAKQKKIEELSVGAGAASVDPAAAGGGISADERAKLEAQIKELQGKLSEYEIISEDIADLSFYKEQNARLQKELDAVKGGASAPSQQPPVAAQDPIAASVSALAGNAPMEQAAAPEAAPVPVPAPVPAPVATAAAPASPAASAEPPAPPVENIVDDELMAEFAAAVEKQKPSGAGAEASTDLGAMNMDKMLAEAAQIKTDVPDLKPEDVLGQSMDENKLLAEANAMKSEDGKGSEDKKLMGEFENFVKKGDT